MCVQLLKCSVCVRACDIFQYNINYKTICVLYICFFSIWCFIFCDSVSSDFLISESENNVSMFVGSTIKYLYSYNIKSNKILVSVGFFFFFCLIQKYYKPKTYKFELFIIQNPDFDSKHRHIQFLL